MTKYFFYVFALSWICFALAVLVPPIGSFIFLIGVFMPGLISIWLTGVREGTQGLQRFFTRIFEWRVGWQWYAFALLYMLAIRFAAAGIQRVATGAWPQFSHPEWMLLLLAVIVSTPVQAGEEVGWRGYALPRLGARIGYAWGSLLLGAVWAIWHLPTFFMLPGNGNYHQSFPLFFVGVCAISIAMGWLYVHSSGSVLLAMIMHSAIDQTHEIVQSGAAIVGPLALNTTLMSWLTLLLLWICAIYFMVRMPRRVTAT